MAPKKTNPKKVNFTLNGKKVSASLGQTILEVAEKHGIEIPTLCYHPDLKVQATCRICTVETAPGVLETACSTQVREGMRIKTNSPLANQARQTNLELISSEHCEKCGTCIWSFDCHLLELMEAEKAKINCFFDRKANRKQYSLNNILTYDARKCIDCRNCIEMCQLQQVNYWETKKRGADIEVVPTKDPKRDCIYCGQCVTHCPVGAIQGQGHFNEVIAALQDPEITTVFQFAPSIRSSIGEEFGLPYGKVMTGQMTAAIRKLGANKVFDVCMGADMTTYEEAKELAERLEGKGPLPMFTSCCPAWVKYVEFYHPELIPNLTTVRSPHMMSGGLTKTYWAKKAKIDPRKIRVISIMPCTAKKYESTRPEFRVKGLKPVDYVLTTRELAYLLLRHQIKLDKLKPEPADHPLGEISGASVIYGASGGVMESALRSGYYFLTGKNLKKFELKSVRGQKGLKTAAIKIGQRLLKVAVANGIVNAEKIIKELQKDPHKYDYIEIMACPGGCIGGGGQPVPVSPKIRAARAKTLYSLDPKMPTRTAHDNPVIKEIYRTYLTSPQKIHPLCHSHFSPKKRET